MVVLGLVTAVSDTGTPECACARFLPRRIVRRRTTVYRQCIAVVTYQHQPTDEAAHPTLDTVVTEALEAMVIQATVAAAFHCASVSSSDNKLRAIKRGWETIRVFVYRSAKAASNNSLCSSLCVAMLPVLGLADSARVIARSLNRSPSSSPKFNLM